MTCMTRLEQVSYENCWQVQESVPVQPEMAQEWPKQPKEQDWASSVDSRER